MPNFLPMGDNSRSHGVQLVEKIDIIRMDWSAGSPDVSSIEHVWDTVL